MQCPMPQDACSARSGSGGWRHRVADTCSTCCLLVAAYYASAHLGFALEFTGPVASIVWLPVGVGAAFLYLRGPALWPGVVIGDLLVNNYSELPVGSAVGQSFGNLLEVVIWAALLRRLISRDRPLWSIPGLAAMLGAITAGTAISATIGSVSLALGGVVTGGLVRAPVADMVARRLLRRAARALARARVGAAAPQRPGFGATSPSSRCWWRCSWARVHHDPRRASARAISRSRR